ncbi:MAG TPA: glycosyltransferase [Lacunisphaera sp.]|jgi:glycosyltransferase involved in cell wall biosynthesis
MSKAKILILSSSNLCRNPRVVKEAMTLGGAGYDVTVLTISSQPRFELLDLDLMRNQSFTRLTVGRPKADWRSRFASGIQRAATWSARRMIRYLRIESAQALGAAGTLLRRARTIPADLTIVHTEIPIWAAQQLIKDGRRVAVDIEDWYSEDLMFRDRRSRPLRLLRRAENFALHNAAYASTTSRSMAEGLARALGCPAPLVLRNVFPLQSVSRIDRPVGNLPLKFIWFSQTIGPGRGLELFLVAWSRTKNPSTLHLLGDERPGYCDQLRDLLPAHRRGDLHVLPLVPPDALPGVLANHDLGLAIEVKWPLNRDLTISNKIFQYMNAGLAVIATDTAGQVEVMNAAPQCGLLIKAGETTRLTAELDALLADRVRLRSMQEAARRSAEQKFSWEHEAPHLLIAVQNVLQPV